jgi:hypothetical protein
MVVVGNKCDMKKRVVSKQEGKTLADEFGAGFLEISVCSSHTPALITVANCDIYVFLSYFGDQAKENLKVKDAFQTLVQKIIQKSPKTGAVADGAAGVFGGGKADT